MDSILNVIENLNGKNTIDLIIAIILIAVLDILSPVFAYIILKLFNFKKSKKEIKNNTFFMPIKVFFKISGIYWAILFLKPDFNFSDEFIELVTKIYKIVVTITIANSLANSITRKSGFIRLIKEKSDKEINDNATKILVRVIKVLIYIVAIFIVFAEIGYDLSGLVTGLGLGSVVVTLAAQDTIKNLLGGIMIFMDRPFMVGEYIKFGTYQGTVEDMTLRSTRIRTSDNSIVQIPNSLISSDSVTNLSKIQRRYYNLRLHLPLDTKLEKIDRLKEKIYNLLLQNKNVAQDTINIHFTEIETNGITITVATYLDVSDYMQFLDIKEDINKNILKILEEENIQLEYDTKIVQVKS